jgi:hypothetical protein
MGMAYSCGHDGAYVFICVQAWLHICVHVHTWMIVCMCAYTHGHVRAYVCIYVQERLLICSTLACGDININNRQDKTKWGHTSTFQHTKNCSKAMPQTCSISTRTELTSNSRWGCGDENIKSRQGKTKCDQLEGLDTVYAHTCESIFIRHSATCLAQRQAQSLGVHGNNQVRPCSSHVLAQAAREQPCRSQAIMPMFSGGARWCTKNSWELKG